ncbi:MAG: NAD(P)-binding domain-containing protein [Deltaproteobacteria bacterium]|nr:NAD(P)-binding domain-containing protein [Deltaproteobacteria bacterium]
MKVGVLGTGDVGHALGNGFIALGHEVKMGARDAANEKAAAWAKAAGDKASHGTFADAAAFGELIVLATLGAANEAAIEAAGIDNFDGKAVVDTTNPLDFSAGMPPKLYVGHTDSAGEQVQRLLPKAHVVKAFNTVGSPHMFRPEFPDGPPDMFICRQRRRREGARRGFPFEARLGRGGHRRHRGLALSRADVPDVGAARRAQRKLESRVQAVAQVGGYCSHLRSTR